jgi:competence ComEA-like helix-hairpin-helix protein
MLAPERRAVLLLLGLAIAGQGVRYLATRPGDAPGQVQLLSVLPPGSPAAQRDSTVHQARPLAAGERIDGDVASAADLSRLPRVGLALAKTIVADRDSNGPFGSLASLDRVPGVGPGLLRALGPHLTFSRAESARINRIAPSAGVGTTFASPHSADAVAGQIGPREGSLNVNRATAVELEGLPGIGPALAARIVADREARGSFATISAMDRVPGIGPALLSRLGRLVTAP